MAKPTSNKIVNGRYTYFLGSVTDYGDSGYIHNTTSKRGLLSNPYTRNRGNMLKTEYRDRYSASKHFHKMDTPVTYGRLNESMKYKK